MAKSDLRILFVFKTLAPYHLPRLGHAAVHLPKNYEVTCISIADTQVDYSWSSEKSIDSVSKNFNTSVLFPGQKIEDVSFALQVRKLYLEIKEMGPSIVFFAGYSHLPMLICSHLASWLGARIVVMSDSSYQNKPRNAYVEYGKRRLLTCFDGALVAGRYSHDYAVSLGIDPMLVDVCCDVVDNSHVHQTVCNLREARVGGKEHFLFVGRFIREKNISCLLDAYSLYRKKVGIDALPLVLCGSGPLEKQLLELVQSKGLVGVEFAGYKSHPDIYDYYSRARALVLPSEQETWGLVVNEALAAGVPVIVSDACGCVPELVLQAKTGWVFQSGDAQELFRLMLCVHDLEDADLQQLSLDCVAHIQDWGLPRFSAGVANLCNKLVGETPI